MDYQFKGFFFLQSLPCLFAVVLIWILWKRRHVEGVLYLILFECAAAIWAIADSFEHAATDLTIKTFWYQFSIFGASTIPALFLLFTLAFTQNNKFINWKTSVILFAVPVITILLTFTNHYHHLILKDVNIDPVVNESVYNYGSWFWIYVFYELGLVVLSIIILFIGIHRFYNIYKKQIIYLIIAPVLPLIATILFIFKLTPLRADLTPVALIFSGIIITYGIYFLGIFDIMPVARKQIINNLSDGIIVVDMADRIIDANPATESILGIKQKLLIGNPFDSIKPIILSDNVDNLSHERYSTETVIKVGQEEKHYEVTYNPVVSFSKKLIGNIYILHDITKRKKALDSAVESNQRLRQEIIEKEKLIADLDAYARSVAHDLKNPISGLLGLSELIKDDIINQKNDEAFELLDLAHEQSLKMYVIVDELLLLSRIRKEDIKLEVLDMAAIFNEASKRLFGQCKQENVKIELPESWPSVLGHPQWIEEVWFNFISNAVKYGGIPPVMKIGFDKINNQTCRFWIQDNGNGLSEELCTKVFNDFERLGKKNVEGNGLGLSIVKRIIEKLGGEVSVVSENLPGKGCIFSFTLQISPETTDSTDTAITNHTSKG